MDGLRSDDVVRDIGVPVTLASSYHGGDRYIAKCYQNAMVITHFLGKPSLFITFTESPTWPEIRRSLEHGQPSNTRPDLIATVFKLKLDELLKDLKERHIFGKCIGCVYTIEYQKRGPPHAHILLFLHRSDVPRTAAMVDELKEIVKSQMTHGPCGPDSRSPCMQNERCSKGFPKRWCEEKVLTEGSYPEYARPRDVQTWGTERFTFDNRWVVPFNPYLSKKYSAHINVEVAKGVHAIKYLAKYVYKGSDRATLSIGDRYDEIAMTVQGRYISPVQAKWRLFEYSTHQEKPAVKILPYHIQGNHQVIFNANMSPSDVEAAAQSQSSPFLDWMNYNTRNSDGRDLLYSDLPLFFVHDRNQGWRKRVKGQQIGRMNVAYPSQRESFHFRMLLTVKRGVQSYEDLFTVEGHRYDNPTSACLALGLIADDSNWGDFLDQIKDTASAGSLRQTFASIMANATVINPQGLWDNFKDFLTDDCLYWISVMGDSLNIPPASWTAQQSRLRLWIMVFGREIGGG